MAAKPVGKSEEKELKLEINLPQTGFGKVMFFNRFHIEREDSLCLVQFGLFSASALIDTYAVLFTKSALEHNKQTVVEYLGRIGRPDASNVNQWKGSPIQSGPGLADVITMSVREDTSETCIYCFSHSAVNRAAQSGANKALPAQAMALLRSSPEIQKQLIVGLYEEG